MSRREDSYLLWSPVVGAAFVSQSDRAWRALAFRAWRKNDLKDIVTFSFDRHDRLIGVVELPAKSL